MNFQLNRWKLSPHRLTVDKISFKVGPCHKWLVCTLSPRTSVTFRLATVWKVCRISRNISVELNDTWYSDLIAPSKQRSSDQSSAERKKTGMMKKAWDPMITYWAKAFSPSIPLRWSIVVIKGSMWSKIRGSESSWVLHPLKLLFKNNLPQRCSAN